MSVTASDNVIKQPSESILYTFNFTALLSSGETLSSVTSLTEDGTSDLTIGTATVNTAAVTVDGTTIAIGMAVQARISGGTDGEAYRLECICTTSDSNTRELDGILKVRDK